MKKDASSYVPSSHSTLKAYDPFGGAVQSCSFADVSILSVLPMFFCVVVMLSRAYGLRLTICFSSLLMQTRQSEWCIRAKVTVRGSFTFSFGGQVAFSMH